MKFKFRPEKALEAILYVAPRVRDRDMYLTLKTLYVADKYHLERYGRFIFGDWYSAMGYGPVGSHAYDVVKFARGDHAACVVSGVKEALAVDGNTLNARRDPDPSLLSESDIECLQEAVNNYGALTFDEAKDESHDEAWKATERNGQMAIQAIAATLRDAPSLIQHLEDRHPDA